MAAYKNFALGKDMKLSATTPSLTEIFVKSASLTEKCEEIDATESGSSGYGDSVPGTQQAELTVTCQTRTDATQWASFTPGTEFEGVQLAIDRSGTKKHTFSNLMLFDVSAKVEVKAGLWEFDARFKTRGSYTRIS